MPVEEVSEVEVNDDALEELNKEETKKKKSKKDKE